MRNLAKALRVLLVLAVAFAASCQGPQPTTVRRAVVSAASPEAAEAGSRILLAGGNAVDAAVAVSFALAVTEPAMSGLGGQTQILMFDPESGGRVLNGTSFAPAATPEEATPDEIVGHRATTIPTTVRTLDYAWRNYGSGALSWAELLAPAIEYAEEGFPIGAFRHKVWLRHREDLRASPSAAELFLNPDGSVPEVDALWKQAVLARTLRRLADEGAEDFYSGEIAREISADMRQNGGWIDEEDLSKLPPLVELEPLRGTYREFDVWTLPPPGGGWVVLHMLAGLNRLMPEQLALENPERPLHLASVLRAGHRIRRERPIADLVDYEEDVAERLRESGETTHFSVVDASGLAVSVTASINAYFGARVASTELGFLYNDYMHEFRTGEPDHPFAVGPGKMPYSSMSPTILSREGEARLVLGSPGSARIISTVAQIAQLWADGGTPIGNALAATRVHALGDGRLFLESEPSAEILAQLAEAGFERTEPRLDLATRAGNPYFGGVHAIAFENGQWRGAADPRRDGLAIGVTME